MIHAEDRPSHRRKIRGVAYPLTEQFKSGSKNFLDVLTAQRELLNQENTLAQARTDIIVNYVSLQKALGGGWNGRVDVETPEIVDLHTGPHLVKPLPSLSPLDRLKRQQ
jgi:hypothetical protein